MSVEIEPTELGFQRPFTAEVSQILRIRNPNHTPVAFKVKTTAPKQYCVRPNSGRIEPGKEVEVTVLLQAMKEQPPPDAKCRDKFLVQSVAVTADKEFTNIGAIWQHVDDAERSSVQEKKIRVVYQAGEGAAATPLKNGISVANGGHSTPENAPPAYSSARSPSPEATFTPQTTRTSLSQSKVDDEPKPIATTARETVTSVATSIPTYDELKVELEKAKEKIVSLSQEGGLRLRKVAAGETSNQTVNDVAKHIQQQQGVPLQIVAALCLLCFLIAYFFF
ncbi:vap [Hyphodiscus hymeniophilus]|uniref:Vap n=1 Tax=Hyphodiscus hymeniophilus TaxID=353542 RepID=A0A9P7B0P7_9HELO|nr:vap [Hyphodiscus hymeniophilus]